jgi:hypothetical protein
MALKRYVCNKYPFLAIGKTVKFNNGYFETENEDEQKLIESREYFGAYLFFCDPPAPEIEPEPAATSRKGANRGQSNEHKKGPRHQRRRRQHAGQRQPKGQAGGAEGHTPGDEVGDEPPGEQSAGLH